MGESLDKQNSDFLIAIYQNIQTSIQSINNILDKVKDSKLKRELKSQYKDYDRLQDVCEDLAKVYEIDIHDNSFFIKAKMWIQVNMAILMDKSNRKIASIMMIGTNMGVIDLICCISDSELCRSEFMELANELLDLERNNIEKLKPYLLRENNKLKEESERKKQEEKQTEKMSQKNKKTKQKDN